MIFRVLKHEGVNVQEFKNTVNIDYACYEVDMGIDYAAGKDIIEVHLNGVLLVEGIDYNVDSGRIVKVDRSEAWNPYNIAGQKMFIKVMRNNAVAVEPSEGSVSIDKLSPELAEDLRAIDGLIDIVNVQNKINKIRDTMAEIFKEQKTFEIVKRNRHKAKMKE